MTTGRRNSCYGISQIYPRLNNFYEGEHFRHAIFEVSSRLKKNIIVLKKKKNKQFFHKF